MKDQVLIKSNKYGITIYFDSDSSFEELLEVVKNEIPICFQVLCSRKKWLWNMKAVLSQKMKSGS